MGKKKWRRDAPILEIQLSWDRLQGRNSNVKFCEIQVSIFSSKLSCYTTERENDSETNGDTPCLELTARVTRKEREPAFWGEGIVKSGGIPRYTSTISVR